MREPNPVRNLLRIGVLAVSAAVSFAQEPPGSSPTIALEAPQILVDVAFDSDGKAEVGLSGTTAYGLRLDSESAGAQTSLICTADPVILREHRWNRVTGACRILISIRGGAVAATQSVRLNISRAPYPSIGELSPGDMPERDVEIRIAAPKSAAIAPGRIGTTLAIVAGGLLLAAIAGLLVYLRRRNSAQADWEQFVEAAGEPAEEFAAGAAPPSTHPAPVRVRRPELSPSPAAAAERLALDDILKRLRQLEEREYASQPTLARGDDELISKTVNDLGRSAAMLCDEARRLNSSVAQNLTEINRWVSSLETLAAIPPDRLSVLLSAAPETALAMRASPEPAATIASRFDAAVRESARETLAVKGELEHMAKTFGKVLTPLEFLIEAAAKLENRRLTDRLVDVRGEIQNISREVAAALTGGADRVCLYFRLDLSTLGGTEQSLTNELAACLRKQLVRLADPVAYFGMRFELTVGQALQEVVDCCDSLLDPGQRIDNVQKQIAAFVKEADATLIQPKPGTPLLDNEHAVFGVVRCSNPGDKPDHISMLRVRGLKRRGQVLRKASVMIFS